MSKDLEKYIQKHRDQMDFESPSDQVWSGIKKGSKKLNQGSGWNTLLVWQIAASVLLVTTLSLLFILNRENGNQKLASLGDLSAEYQLIENNYEQSIQEMYTTLDFEKIDRGEYEWLFEELDYLDSLNLKFREDIGLERDEDRLVEILIDYYEKKLKLLRKLELEINRTNYENEMDDEEITI